MDEQQLMEFNDNMEKGQEEFDGKRYESAWDYFYAAYTIKNNFFKSKSISHKNINDEGFAKVCYCLSQIMKKINGKDPLILKLMKEDEGLKVNKYKGAKARKFIGRKYLKLAADKDYPLAIIEYALNCIGYAPKGKLDYEYNEDNLDTALYWANNVMKKHRNKDVSAMGYCIDAIYCLDKYKIDKDESMLEKFAENILEANKINEEKFQQYITYYLGYLYSYPKLENYENGKYFDYEKGLNAFDEVISKGDDSYLIRAAKKLKEGIEKYKE